MADYFIYLDDIATAIKNIEKITRQATKESLKGDDILLGNVTADLETIGEAVKRIPLAVRKDQPGILWSNYLSLCGIADYDYPNVDIDRIWDMVKDRLEPLKAAVAKLLEA